MRKSIWLPLVLSLVIGSMPLLVLPFLPETLRHRPAEPLNQDSMAGNEEQPAEFSTKAMKEPMSQLVRQLKETVQFMFHDRDVAIAVSAFMFSNVGMVSS